MSAADTPVLAIRPEPGLSSTMALGRGMGLNMHGYALSQVKAVEWDILSTKRFDALLVGSANAMRHGGANLSKLAHLPVHAVGEATAREAKAAGFSIERLGKGGLQTVLDALVAAMGERIVEPARASQSGNWAGIHTSSEPSDEALLALVKGLCQKR